LQRKEKYYTLRTSDCLEYMNSSQKPAHYYGDVVRKLFVLAAAFMLFSLPFFREYTPVSLSVSLIIILVLDIIAGVTNPRQKWGAFLDTTVASIGLFGFGYFAAKAYIEYGVFNFYFWENQALAIVFLFALYFSIKTLRGFYVPD